MKQVWRCDFCHETNVEKHIVEEHELACVFNPLIRNCYSCKYFDAGYGDLLDICNIKFVDFYDVLDDEAECTVYEEEL